MKNNRQECYQEGVELVWDWRGGEKWAQPNPPSVCIPQMVGESGNEEHKRKVLGERISQYWQQVKQKIEDCGSNSYQGGVVSKWTLWEI